MMIIYDVYFMYFTKKKRLQKGTDVSQVYENDVTEYKLDSYWQVDLDSSVKYRFLPHSVKH